MILNVLFDNATVYDFKKLDVVIGEKFVVEAVDFNDGTQWFFDNDPVLEIIPEFNKAAITAKQEGTSTILFIRGNQIVDKLEITVVNPVVLNLEIEKIEMK